VIAEAFEFKRISVKKPFEEEIADLPSNGFLLFFSLLCAV
jgi:hypothetical protein